VIEHDQHDTKREMNRSCYFKIANSSLVRQHEGSCCLAEPVRPFASFDDRPSLDLSTLGATKEVWSISCYSRKGFAIMKIGVRKLQTNLWDTQDELPSEPFA